VNVDQVTALLVAATGLITAIGVVAVQLRGLRKEINGRMEQLLTIAAASAHKEGEMVGRDFTRAQLSQLHPPPPDAS
jgi:hypothetical protein